MLHLLASRPGLPPDACLMQCRLPDPPPACSRGDMLCGWNEPPLATVDGTPNCLVNGLEQVSRE